MAFVPSSPSKYSTVGFHTSMKETGQDFDFNSYVVEHPSSSYLIKFTKHHMQTAGIFPGDLLVIDKSLAHRVGDIVLAQVDQETCLGFYDTHEKGGYCIRGSDLEYCIVAQEQLTIIGTLASLVRSYHTPCL